LGDDDRQLEDVLKWKVVFAGIELTFLRHEHNKGKELTNVARLKEFYPKVQTSQLHSTPHGSSPLSSPSTQKPEASGRHHEAVRKSPNLSLRLRPYRKNAISDDAAFLPR
jgi:hypothetical protein